LTTRFPLGRMFGLLPATMLASWLVAAGPAPVGSLVGCKDAVLDGRPPLAHTTILSGDRLKVNDGLAIVSLGRGNRIVLAARSEVSFLSDGGSVTVSLVRGGIWFLHPQAGSDFKIVAFDVAIQPSVGSRTLGEITMVDGLLMITPKEGEIDVEQSGVVRQVAEGGTITVPIQTAQSRRSSAEKQIKYILDHQKLVIGALVAGGAATAIAAIATADSSKEVSPTVPSF